MSCIAKMSVLLPHQIYISLVYIIKMQVHIQLIKVKKPKIKGKSKFTY